MQSSHVVGFPRNWSQWLPWGKEMWRMEGGVNEGEIFFTVYTLLTFRFTYSKINFKKKKHTKQSSRGQIQSESLLQASLVAY